MFSQKTRRPYRVIRIAPRKNASDRVFALTGCNLLAQIVELAFGVYSPLGANHTKRVYGSCRRLF